MVCIVTNNLYVLLIFKVIMNMHIKAKSLFKV